MYQAIELRFVLLRRGQYTSWFQRLKIESRRGTVLVACGLCSCAAVCPTPSVSDIQVFKTPFLDVSEPELPPNLTSLMASACLECLGSVLKQSLLCTQRSGGTALSHIDHHIHVHPKANRTR